MKQTLAAFLLLAAIACDSPKKENGYGTGRDTVRTVVIFAQSPIENLYKTGSAVRFSWDTTLPDPKDKTRNVPARDTFYNIRINYVVKDSLGQAIKTAAGRDSVYDDWITYNKSMIVHDFNYNFLPVYEAQVQAIRGQAKR